MPNILTNFLKAGLKSSMPVMGGVMATWNSVEYECIYNETSEDEELEIGGFNAEGDGLIIFIATDEFTDGYPARGDLITINSEDWRVARIVKGNVRIEFRLENKEKRRNV